MTLATNYLIVHGAEGDAQENWFPWLRLQLEMLGHSVAVPNFPTPRNQNLAAWTAIAHDVMARWLPQETVIVGHSTGALLALRLAEGSDLPFKAVVAVCPFARDLNLPFYDKLNATFLHPSPDWARVKRGAKEFVVYAGDDDPYVPLAYAQEVANKVCGRLVVIPSGGHLNRKAGFTEFPALLNTII